MNSTVDTYNFCTLFDSGYLSRGLALYHSLNSFIDKFHIYIFAFDDDCFEKLKSLKLENATIVSLFEFEDKELLKVKPTRNKAEYCWTCAPSTIWYAIHHFELKSCSYLDADIYFYNSPKIIFEEIGDKSVAITQHNFSIGSKEILVGKYCVQFNYFKNDINGLEALKWWKDSCLDWCYARYEDGKFADQKYIDELPTRFNNVHIIQNRGAGMAQWNIEDYIFEDFDKLHFIEKQTLNNFQIVFYHFHYTRYLFNEGTLTLKPFKVPIDSAFINNLYVPYVKELAKINAGITNNEKLFEIKKVRIKKMKSLLYFFLKIKYSIRDYTIVRLTFNFFSKLGVVSTYKGSQG